MYVPPIDPRDRTAPRQPTWRNVLTAYALLAAVPLSLWVVSDPLAGVVGLAAIASLSIGARRAAGLVRCFYDCGEFALEPVDAVRITVTKRAAGTRHADDSEPEATRPSASCC